MNNNMRSEILKNRKTFLKNHSKSFALVTSVFLIFANILSFQNCSKVAVEDIQTTDEKVLGDGSNDNTDAGSVQPTVSSTSSDCLNTGRLNGEKWLVFDGTTRNSEACKVGQGMLFHVMNVQKELICQNGQVNPTGMTQSTDSGRVEGSCDLSCGGNKDGQLFWKEIGQNTEEKSCPTSLTVKMNIKYLNEAQYKCSQGQILATGETRRTVLSESECPPLAFNDQDQVASIAFEDTYIPKAGVANAADHDYNDFVATIKVLEKYNSLEQLTEISIEYTAKKKVSGLDSQLILVFDGQVRGRNGWVSNVSAINSEPMFEGNANIEVKTFNSDRLVSTKTANKSTDLIVFSSTAEAINSQARVQVRITGLDGKLNTLSLRKSLSIKRYRSLLHVMASNQGYDVDLSDINPAMYDNMGMPLAFFLPVNWRAPKESQLITVPYPKFKDHSAYLSSGRPLEQEPEDLKNWFHYLARPDLVY